jgi:zinc resistance-associated protein
MMRRLLLPFAALAACAFAPAAQAGSDQSPERAIERMQHWSADHEALLDAKLAGLKAGLRLTSDQDKLWPPFETAVRDAAELHMEQMKSMMERMHRLREMIRDRDESENVGEMGAPPLSPVDRLEAIGQRLSARGAAITKVADAVKPLYASLDDSQKRLFGLLGRELFMMGHHRHAMHGGIGMMHGMLGGMGMMGHRGMGPKSDRMEPAGNDSDEDEDSSDEE